MKRALFNSTFALSAIFAATACAQATKPITLYYSDARQDFFTSASAQGDINAKAANYATYDVNSQGLVLTNPKEGTAPLIVYWNAELQDCLTLTPELAGEILGEESGYQAYETVGFVYKDKQPSTVPLKLYVNKSKSDTLTTVSTKPLLGLPGYDPNDYQEQVIVGYVEIESREAPDHPYFHKDVEKHHGAPWDYSPNSGRGPGKWGGLDAEYSAAKNGKEQSPINISSSTPAINITNPQGNDHDQLLNFDYQVGLIDLVNNGHTIQDWDENESILRVHGQEFSLIQFHFHAPSEHTIDNKHFPMEMHLVHKDAHNRLAVVGIMIKEGPENLPLQDIWNVLPTKSNPRVMLEKGFSAQAILPKKLDYITYMGSFTTPPCTEHVTWYILSEPITLSKNQIERFKQLINGNNRPVQSLNNRRVRRVQSGR